MKIILWLYASCVHLVLSKKSDEEYRQAFLSDPEIGARLKDACMNSDAALSSKCKTSVSTEAKAKTKIPVVTCYVNPNIYYRDCDKAMDLIMRSHTDHPNVFSQAYGGACDTSESTCKTLWEKIEQDDANVMVSLYDTLCAPSQEARNQKKCQNILVFAKRQYGGNEYVALQEFFGRVINQKELDQMEDAFAAMNTVAIGEDYRTNCVAEMLSVMKQIHCEGLVNKSLGNDMTPENINKILKATCVEAIACYKLTEVILGSERADDVFLFSCNMDNSPETYQTDTPRQETCKNFFSHCETSTATGCTAVKNHQKMAEALEVLDNPGALKEKLNEICREETVDGVMEQETERITGCGKIMHVIANNEEYSKGIFEEVCTVASADGAFDLCSIVRQGIYWNKDLYKKLFLASCPTVDERKSYKCQTFRTVCQPSEHLVCKLIYRQFAVDTMIGDLFSPVKADEIAKLYQELCDGDTENFCVAINEELKSAALTDLVGTAQVTRILCTTTDTLQCQRNIKETLSDPKGYDRFVGVCDVTKDYNQDDCNVFFGYCNNANRTVELNTICEEKIGQDEQHLENKKTLEGKDEKETAKLLNEICVTSTKYEENCGRALNLVRNKNQEFFIETYKDACEKYGDGLCGKMWINVIGDNTPIVLVKSIYDTLCTTKELRGELKCMKPIDWCRASQSVEPCLTMFRQSEADGMNRWFEPFDINDVSGMFLKLCDGKSNELCAQLTKKLMDYKGYAEISATTLEVCKTPGPACDTIAKAILKSEKWKEIYTGVCDVEKDSEQFISDTYTQRMMDCKIFFGVCIDEAEAPRGCAAVEKDYIYLNYALAIKSRDGAITAEQLEKACSELDPTNCERLYKMILKEKEWSLKTYVSSCDTGKSTCDANNQFLEKIAPNGYFEYIYTETCTDQNQRTMSKCSRFKEWCEKQGAGSKHSALCVGIVRRFEADTATTETVFNPSSFGDRYARFCDGATEDLCVEQTKKLKTTSLSDLAATTRIACEVSTSTGCKRIVKETLLLNNAYARFVEICPVISNYVDTDCKLFFDFCASESSVSELTAKGKETCEKGIKEDQVHIGNREKLNLKNGPKESAKVLQKACKEENAQFTRNCQRALDVVAADKKLSVKTYKENCDTYHRGGSCEEQWETMTKIRPHFHMKQTFEQLCAQKEERKTDKCKIIDEWCAKDATNKAITRCIYIKAQYEMDEMEKSFNPFDKEKVAGLYTAVCDGKTVFYCDEVSKRVMETRVTKEQISDVTTTICATPSPNVPCAAIMKTVLSDEKRFKDIYGHSCDVEKNAKEYHTTGQQKKYCEMYFAACESAFYVGCAQVKEDDKFAGFLKNYDEADAVKTSKALSAACDDVNGPNCKRMLKLIMSDDKKEFTYNVYKETCAVDGNTCRRMFQEVSMEPGFVEYIAENGCNIADEVREGKCKTIRDWCSTRSSTDSQCKYISRAATLIDFRVKNMFDKPQDSAKLVKTVCDGASSKLCTEVLNKVFSDKKPEVLAKFYQINDLICLDPTTQACQTFMGEMLKTPNYKERYHAVCNVDEDLPLSNCKVFFDYCPNKSTLGDQCSPILTDSQFGEVLKMADGSAGSAVALGTAIHTFCKESMEVNCERVLKTVAMEKFKNDQAAIFKAACDGHDDFCKTMWDDKFSFFKSVKEMNNEACATAEERKKHYCQVIRQWCSITPNPDCPLVSASFEMDEMSGYFEPFQAPKVASIYDRVCYEESERCTEILGKLMVKTDYIDELLLNVCALPNGPGCQRFVKEIVNANEDVFNEVYNKSCEGVKMNVKQNKMCYPFFAFCDVQDVVQVPRCTQINSDALDVAGVEGMTNNSLGTARKYEQICKKEDKSECDRLINTTVGVPDESFLEFLDIMCSNHEPTCLMIVDAKFGKRTDKSIKMLTEKCVKYDGIKIPKSFCKPIQRWCEEHGPSNKNEDTKKECEKHLNKFRLVELATIFPPSLNIPEIIKFSRGFCDPEDYAADCTSVTDRVKKLSTPDISTIISELCKGVTMSSEKDFKNSRKSCQKIIEAVIAVSDEVFKSMCDVTVGWNRQKACNLFYYACPLTDQPSGGCSTILLDRALDEVGQRTSPQDKAHTAEALSALCLLEGTTSELNCERFLDFFVFKEKTFFVSGVLSDVCTSKTRSCTIMIQKLASHDEFSASYERLCRDKTDRINTYCQVFKDVCILSVHEKCDFISKQFEVDEMAKYFAFPFDEEQQKELVDFFTRMCDGKTEELCDTVLARLTSTRQNDEPTKTSRLSQSPTIITGVCEATADKADERKGCAILLKTVLGSRHQYVEIYARVCQVEKNGLKPDCQNFYDACTKSSMALHGCTEYVKEDMELLEYIKGINKSDVTGSLETIVKSFPYKNHWNRLVVYTLKEDEIFATKLTKDCFITQRAAVCKELVKKAHEKIVTFASLIVTAHCSSKTTGVCEIIREICASYNKDDRCYEAHKMSCKGKNLKTNKVCADHVRFYCKKEKPQDKCIAIMTGARQYHGIAEDLAKQCSIDGGELQEKCVPFYTILLDKVEDVLMNCDTAAPTQFCQHMKATCDQTEDCQMTVRLRDCSQLLAQQSSALQCEDHFRALCTEAPLFGGAMTCKSASETVNEETYAVLSTVSTQCSTPILDGLQKFCEDVGQVFHKEEKGTTVFDTSCRRGVFFDKPECKVLRYTCTVPKWQVTPLCEDVQNGVNIFEAYKELKKSDSSAVVAFLNKFCVEKPEADCKVAENLLGEVFNNNLYASACDDNANKVICDRYFKKKIGTANSVGVFEMYNELCPEPQFHTLKCEKVHDWCGDTSAPTLECTVILRAYKVDAMDKTQFENFDPAKFAQFYEELCLDGSTKELCERVERRMLSPTMASSVFPDIVAHICRSEVACSRLLQTILNSERSDELFVANCNVDSKQEINCGNFFQHCEKEEAAAGCVKVKEDEQYRSWRNGDMHKEKLEESRAALRLACKNGDQLAATNCQRLFRLVLEEKDYAESLAERTCENNEDAVLCNRLIDGSLKQFLGAVNDLAEKNCVNETDRESLICKTIDGLCGTGHDSKCYTFHKLKCNHTNAEKLVCFNIFKYYCGTDYLPSIDAVTTPEPSPNSENRLNTCWEFILKLTNTPHKHEAFGEQCTSDSIPCTRVVELDFERGDKKLLQMLFSRQCDLRIDPILCNTTMTLCKDTTKIPECLVVEKPTCTRGTFEQCQPVLDRHCRPLNPSTCRDMIEYAESDMEKTGRVLNYHCESGFVDELCRISLEKADQAALLAGSFNASCEVPEKLKSGQCQQINTYCNMHETEPCRQVRKMIDDLEIRDKGTCQEADAVCEEKVQKYCIDTSTPVCDILFDKMPKAVLFHFYNQCKEEKGSETVCEKAKKVIREKRAVGDLFAERCPGLAFISKGCKDIKNMCDEEYCSEVNVNYKIVLYSGIAALALGVLFMVGGLGLYLYKMKKTAQQLKDTKQKEKSMYLDSMMQ